MLQSSRKKILVAERDPIVLAVVNYLLTRQGHHVEAHDSGERAAASLRERQFDLALISWDLTEAQWLRALFADLPSLHGRVIVTGAPSGIGDLPLLAVLQKPIDFTLMVDTVRRALDGVTD